MTTFFVSRHPGAIEWAQRRGLAVDRQIAHLDPGIVAPGDTVIGTLPIHLAACIHERGARYLNLSLDLPPTARGQELSADELETYGARLEPYVVQAGLQMAQAVVRHHAPADGSLADESITVRTLPHRNARQ